MEGPLPDFPHNIFPASIAGLQGHPVEDVVLDNIDIVYEAGASKETAFFNADSLTSIPEHAGAYPEFSMFGELPAWGFYVRHATGLSMKNITVKYEKEDFRSAMVFDDVNGLQLQQVNIASGKNTPVIILHDTKKLSMKNIKLPLKSKDAIRQIGLK